MIPLSWYLVLAAGLFIIGMVAFLIRRNVIMMLISLELMLNAVNIMLIAASHYLQDIRGQILAFFVMAGAAAGVAIGLALLIAAFRNKETAHMDEYTLLKG
ncbi:MAG: NADH-quinone oxidoreductase subunit NuoK [Nitrospiraceae bacterium]|jgi:NADH-quinone oxidoreductase subunit K|nr:NADH-quinone oxidoreductase subunit NuoK [Nitrospiraceae bacterium]